MMFRAWLIALVGLFTASTMRADFTYLAVGDSSAFGETDRTQNPSNGDRGYVSRFANYMATRLAERPSVMNVAINGETSKSFFTGLVSDRASTDGITLNSRYAPYAPAYNISQNTLMNSILTASTPAKPIKFVTVQIGANDLSNTAETPGFLGLSAAEQNALVGQTINTAATNLAGILTQVRGALPNADIYVIGYHNPYGGSPSHPFYSLAAPAVQGLNGAVAQVGSLFGAKYVNFYPVVAGREQELTLIDRFPADLINYVHLNNKGYEEVSKTLIDASRDSAQFAGTNDPVVPAPPVVILLGVAGLTLAGYRRLRTPAAI
jgi:lysophospholipase L1-like esterase